MAETKGATDEKPDVLLKREVYKGVPMYECEMDKIDMFETREDDISGCAAFLDLVSNGLFYSLGVKFVEQMKSRRMIKSHLHHSMLPVKLQKGKGRIIYISRNLKDIATSYFKLLKWTGSLSESENTLEKFVDTFVNGTGRYCPWPRHVLEYWERRNDTNILFLKYEEVVRDKQDAVRQIAKFLGRKLSADDVAKICDYCSVDNMKANPMCNMSYWRDVTKLYDDRDNGFINQGKTGAWKSLFTPEIEKKLDKHVDEIKGSGLTFDDE